MHALKNLFYNYHFYVLSTLSLSTGSNKIFLKKDAIEAGQNTNIASLLNFQEGVDPLTAKKFRFISNKMFKMKVF